MDSACHVVGEEEGAAEEDDNDDDDGDDEEDLQPPAPESLRSSPGKTGDTDGFSPGEDARSKGEETRER